MIRVVQALELVARQHGGHALHVDFHIRRFFQDEFNQGFHIVPGAIHAIQANIVHPQHDKHFFRTAFGYAVLQSDLLAIIQREYGVLAIFVPQGVAAAQGTRRQKLALPSASGCAWQ